jgi:DNA helicase-2/ATP-dependent DNA helicase PcrA
MVDEVQDYTQTQLMVLASYFPRAHFLLLGDQHQAIVEGSASFGQIGQVFAQTHGSVEECRLLTSYRSSPEITELFCSLLPPEERVTLSSVQRPGVEPVIRECPSVAGGYLQVLRRIAEDAHAKEGLCAIVAQDGARANWIARQLGDLAPLVGKGDTLPKEGVVTLDLRLAKGLEFDSVIIPDAQAEVYPDEPLARRRLYTAVSRAMHEVTILSQGQMTPLLSPYLASHQGERD